MFLEGMMDSIIILTYNVCNVPDVNSVEVSDDGYQTLAEPCLSLAFE